MRSKRYCSVGAQGHRHCQLIFKADTLSLRNPLLQSLKKKENKDLWKLCKNLFRRRILSRFSRL